jgi:hypothetical protein
MRKNAKQLLTEKELLEMFKETVDISRLKKTINKIIKSKMKAGYQFTKQEIEDMKVLVVLLNELAK